MTEDRAVPHEPADSDGKRLSAEAGGSCPVCDGNRFVQTQPHPTSPPDDEPCPMCQGPRTGDSLASIAKEVCSLAWSTDGTADTSERDAMLALAGRALVLAERLQAVIDWADFALAHRQEFDSHGSLNLTGPVFDEARAALALATGASQ